LIGLVEAQHSNDWEVPVSKFSATPARYLSSLSTTE
jgi:hypothetical protein